MQLRRALGLFGTATAVGAVVGLIGGLVLALTLGALVLGLALIFSWSLEGSNEPPVAARRRLLRAIGVTGLGFVVGGSAVGRTVRTLSRPEPRPFLEEIAGGLGAEALELIRRGFHPDRRR